MRRLVGLATTMLFGFCCAAQPPGAAPPPAKQSSIPNNALPKDRANLTKGECEGLGGKVKEVGSACASGQLCQTVDFNGVVHSSCVNATWH